MLTTAAEAGATVHEETSVTSVDAGPDGVTVEAKRGAKTVRYRAKLVAGADGVNSVVARDSGLAGDDSRRVAVAQRAYATVDGDVGEAAFFFAEDLFPGYGWLFPLAGGGRTWASASSPRRGGGSTCTCPSSSPTSSPGCGTCIRAAPPSSSARRRSAASSGRTARPGRTTPTAPC